MRSIVKRQHFADIAALSLTGSSICHVAGIGIGLHRITPEGYFGGGRFGIGLGLAI